MTLLLASTFGCRSTGPQAAATRPTPAAKPTESDLYPKPPAVVRVVALPPITGFSSPSKPSGKALRAITGESKETAQASQLIRPLSLAVRSGKILVCDTGRHAIVEIEPRSGSAQVLAINGLPGPLDPVAIITDSPGNAYVADAAGHRVLRIDLSNTVVQSYAMADPAGFVPIDLAVSADRLYAVNRAGRRVEVFNLSDGKYQGPFAAAGQHPGAFPVAVCLDAASHVYIVDMAAGRVRVYDSAGALLRQMAAPGNRPGLLAQPRSVAVGPDQIVFVSDVATQIVQMFDSTGTLLMYFGGPEGSVGRMNLPAKVITDRTLLDVFAGRLPAGFAAQYLVLVANQVSPGRINVYAFGRMPTKESSVQ